MQEKQQSIMLNIYHSAADAPDVIPRNSLINDCFIKAAQKIPDKSIQLIIADPPYFEVKGGFDFIWESRDAYLRDVEIWAQECKRILADNGTLFWWGMDIKIAYSQVVLDKYFNLINTLVWEKPSLYSEWDTRRSFPERGMERVLMYAQQDENDKWSNEATGWKKIKLDISNFKNLRDYFERVQKFIGKNIKKINEVLGHRKSEHGFYWGSTQWDLPTAQTYDELIKCFKIDQMEGFEPYETLRQEYETLRQEYETLRRPFNNFLKLTDVLKFSQEPNKHNHPTKKPMKLTRALIETCSRKGDLLFIPFGGSGTECEAAIKSGRDFICAEIDKGYFDNTIVPRIKAAQEREMPKLF